jgi:hypothetical protein
MDFLEHLEKEFLIKANYNTLVFDTWHTVARLEDENAASEVNRLGNLTLDVATRNRLALVLGRHDRKSGGDIGVSGRSSIQLSGLVDPGLPNEQVIDLVNGCYENWGEPVAPNVDRAAQVAEWVEHDPGLLGKDIVERFAAMIPAVSISVATANRYKAEAKAKQQAVGKT